MITNPFSLKLNLTDLNSRFDKMFERNIEQKYSLIHNDQISKIYLPLVNCIKIGYDALIKKDPKQCTFIVGITGPVSVGKSTMTELLAALFRQYFGDLKVQTLSVDGFLYSNKELKKKNIFERKGFPESYNYSEIVNFLKNVKAGADNVFYPLYSHETSDVIPNKQGVITKPDILFIEGINLLQKSAKEKELISDYLDLSIYIDADESQIEDWYLARFHNLMDLNKNDPTNFFYSWAHKPLSVADDFARKVWRKTNLPNNKFYIQPTQKRADIVLHKVNDHIVDKVKTRI